MGNKLGMSFNPSKCNIMHVSMKKNPWNHTYTLKDTELEPVNDVTYLGVTLSNNLSWHKHIAKIAAKGNKVSSGVTFDQPQKTQRRWPTKHW